MTRSQRRAGTGLCLAFMGAMFGGCGPAKRGRMAQVGDQAPHGPPITTPEGVIVSYPTWLDIPGAEVAKQTMLDEIRDAVPEPDPRIDPALRGVPAGATVIVLDPGGYYAPYSPTVLATGEVRGSTIYVAWRATQSGPRLPALPHELRHLLTNDPNAGH